MSRVLSLMVVIAVMVAVSSVSAQEGKKKDHKRPDPSAIYKKLDADSNGDLTVKELMASKRIKDEATAEKRIKAMDADGDGKVTEGEFVAAMQKMAQHHKKGGEKKGDHKKKK